MRGLSILVTGLVLVAHPACVLACPSCYGAPDSPMTNGMNMAIMSLLGITGFVLIAFVSFFIYLRRRSLTLHRQFANRLN